MKITDIHAIEILDSRGNPTIRTFITLEDGSIHSSLVPSGASTGSHEAVELRDKDPLRYSGMGVTKAVENVNTVIKNAVLNSDVDPNSIDSKLIQLDGSENKKILGANAILSVSMAVCRAAAHGENKPLWKFLNEYYFRHPEPFSHSEPKLVSGEKSQNQSSEKYSDSSAPPQNDNDNHLTPNFRGRTPKFPRLMVNVVNGGKHAGWNFDIQEFMIVPNTTKPSESVRIAAEIFHSLGKVLNERNLSTLVGDEGGYSPSLSSNEEVLETIVAAAKKAGYENVTDYRLSIDAASTEFFKPSEMASPSEALAKEGKYEFKKQNRWLTPDELTSYYAEIGQKYKILSFEDPFAEDDWEAWKKLTNAPSAILNASEGSQSDSSAKLQNDKLIIIGDDLFVTNPERIQRGIEQKAANAVLIKLNQIGTVKETVEAINLTHQAGWKTAISHRSGETEDSFIADLAYACGSEFIKAGSMSRGERLAKYNRLLEIEQGL